MPDETSQPNSDILKTPFTRRRLLGGVAMVAGAAAMGPIASACGGSSSSGSSSSPSAAASSGPKKGGSLTAGIYTGSAKDSVDPHRLAYEPEIVAGTRAWLAPVSDPPVFAGPPGRTGKCALESYGNNRLVALCTAHEPGLAVFVEQYDRGWQATVDGQPARLLRANLIMRALPIAAGTHRIVLEFRTPGFRAGGALSVASLLVLGLLWLAGRRKARAPSRAGG